MTQLNCGCVSTREQHFYCAKHTPHDRNLTEVSAQLAELMSKITELEDRVKQQEIERLK
jgi:hypothetical protein